MSSADSVPGSPEPEDSWWGNLLRLEVDPSPPEGVVMAQDSEGRWWRYPLREFTE